MWHNYQTKYPAESFLRGGLLFFSLIFSLVLDLGVEPLHEEDAAEDHKAKDRDDKAGGKGTVAVGKAYRVLPLRQQNAYHGIAHQRNFCFLSVHGDGPVAVLGDGGVQQTVPVTVDGAFDLRVGKFRDV